jgi:hypothetical protein
MRPGLYACGLFLMRVLCKKMKGKKLDEDMGKNISRKLEKNSQRYV